MPLVGHQKNLWVNYMGYRIHFFRDDRSMGNIAAEKPLPETLEDAVDLMPLFKADHALILDEVGHLVERIKCSA